MIPESVEGEALLECIGLDKAWSILPSVGSTSLKIMTFDFIPTIMTLY